MAGLEVRERRSGLVERKCFINVNFDRALLDECGQFCQTFFGFRGFPDTLPSMNALDVHHLTVKLGGVLR